ncbi:hypothetical protein D9V84_00860 [Bacteroidetes/Chlorobi group bacterium Naka2016]|nr:MAG: hypothetical protein D9V84_00860 [Bacteroidetes/Chlorobi group bacterium Naka2016]
MKKLISILLLSSMVLILASCFTQRHIIGEGAKGNRVETAKTWYVLWGLVPINNVDTQQMAKGSKNYEIITQFSFVDIIISIFTSFITVYPMSVEVRY